MEIRYDKIKGRTLVNKGEMAFAGSVLFREKAFVFGTWHEQNCWVCENPVLTKNQKKKLKKKKHKKQPSVENHQNCEQLKKQAHFPLEKQQETALFQFLIDLDVIMELDRARCFLKCLLKYHADPDSLGFLFELTCARFDECLSSVQLLRKEFPEILPEELSDRQIAQIISALNTNSHELENLGGSGLFMSACMMEHNCIPNCSFTTFHNELWVTAVKEISKDEALSIDYGNFFYRPTSERKKMLRDSYGFDCTCLLCTERVDRCRGFYCDLGGDNDCKGVVYPKPLELEYNSSPPTKLLDSILEAYNEEFEEFEERFLDSARFKWTCDSCSNTSSLEKIAKYVEAELRYSEDFPETYTDFQSNCGDEFHESRIVGSPVQMYKTHYLHFWALDAIGCNAAQGLTSAALSNVERDELLSIWKRIINLMNIVVPYPHHEKTIYYDNLAQVQIIAGNLDNAVKSYQQAYNISCIVSGENSEPTREILRLVENPPKNRQDIINYYKDRSHNM